ncbi:MAG: AIR synthase-related protein, partial [Actinomycetota bacterium]|nr:AIR synthase-related protein [Actinomycetota bacterium]
SGRAIYPTPVIGMAGVCHSPERSVGLALKDDDDVLLLLGTPDPDAFGGSEYSKVVNGAVAGKPPPLDLVAEKRLHDLLFEAAGAGVLRSAHDVSSGGLAVTLAESAIAGRKGFELDPLEGELHRVLFAEPASCVVVSTDDEDALRALADGAGVPVSRLGVVRGDVMRFGAFDVPLDEATAAFENGLPERLSARVDA